MAEAEKKLHGFTVHPAAARFPMLGTRETRKLSEDIKENGLKQPGLTWKDDLVDGRNRLNAWVEAGLKPKDFPTEELELDDEVDAKDEKAVQRFIVHTIWSLNGVRRHLSDRQKGAIEIKFREDLGQLEDVSDEELAESARIGKATAKKLRAEHKKNPKKIRDLAEGKKGKQGRPSGGAPPKVVSINREEYTPAKAAEMVIEKWADAPGKYLKNFVFQLSKKFEEYEAEQELLAADGPTPNGAAEATA